MSAFSVFCRTTAIALFYCAVIAAFSGVITGVHWMFATYGLLGVPAACIGVGLLAALATIVARYSP